MCIIVIGSRQHALGILGHDGAHGHGIRNLKVNDFLTNLFCFWPIGMHLPVYRRFHFHHHKHIGTLDDPELITKYWSGPNWDLPVSMKLICFNFLIDLSGIGFLTYKRRLFKKKFIDIFLHKNIKNTDHGAKFFNTLETEHKTIHAEIIFMIIAIGILAYYALWNVIILWFVSLLTAAFAFFRIRIWTEHLGTNETHRLKANWWQRMFFFLTIPGITTNIISGARCLFRLFLKHAH